MNKCVYCESEVSESGLYCRKCGKQANCSSCHQTLEADSNFCSFCGASTGSGEKQDASVGSTSHFNTFEFTETKTGRSAKAVLTDRAVENLQETLSLVVTGYPLGSLPSSKRTQTPQNGDLFPPGYDGKEIETIDITPKQVSAVSTMTVDQLKKLFFKDGENLVLEVQDLKATGQKDFGIRLIYLRMLYAKEVEGQDFVAREEINTTLKEVMGTLDPNVVSFITTTNDLSHKEEGGRDYLRLKGDGYSKALNVLAEVADDAKEGTFTLQSRLKSGTKSSGRNDESKSGGKVSKPSSSNKDVDGWISKWNALKLNIDLHGIAKDLGQLDRVTLALWVVHKATSGSVDASSTYKIAPLISKLFFVSGNRGNLNTALKNGYVPRLQKTTDGWRITPEGLKHIQSIVDAFKVSAAKK